MIVYEYDLDMVPGLTQGRTVVSLSQYDDNFFINFHLYTRNGSFVIESGTTARIRGTKPDGNGFSATATVDANDMTVLVEGDKQMTAAAGTSQYELTLMKGTKELNTANFDVYIERAALDIDTPASETKLRELYDMPVDDILETAQAIIDTADEIKTFVRNGWIYENAEGSVASFSDGGDGLPVKSVSVNVDPVQDLHGYSKPWTGGAGKNLLLMTVDGIKAANGGASSWSGNSKVIQGVTFTINTDSAGNVTGIKANGTASANSICNINLNVAYYGEAWLNGCPSNGSNSTYILYSEPNPEKYDTGSGVSINYSNTYTVRIFIRQGYTASNLLFKPMITVASEADKTFEPYSNICPITGHTSAVITRVGKNLLPFGGISEKGVTISTNSNGEIILNGTATSAIIWQGTHSILPAGTYSISVGQTLPSRTYVSVNNESLYMVNPTQNKKEGFTFSEAKDCYLNVFIASGTTFNNFKLNPQVEVGTVATGFEPYQSQTYNITFPGAAGTVYGGTLDLNAGRLTVDKAYIASYSGQSINAPWLSSMDEYAAGRTPTTGAQVVYPLATPITYNFTAEEITTLLGINHIWADTGDVSVEYAADPKLYINKVIANALNA